MSRLIDADALPRHGQRGGIVHWKDIENAPSIDIVFCHDCKFENTRKCPPHRMGLIHDESDYCSYGIRKTDGVDKHDEAVEALGHLIKRMKGTDDE